MEEEKWISNIQMSLKTEFKDEQITPFELERICKDSKIQWKTQR